LRVDHCGSPWEEFLGCKREFSDAWRLRFSVRANQKKGEHHDSLELERLVECRLGYKERQLRECGLRNQLDLGYLSKKLDDPLRSKLLI
jgi:hypothetical protein